ncbi:sensor histidine kinase [Saccharothrix algeriensis]|uniref:Anti-sigma regulatory factor (Ser/Thr protein kinase) n=1 Tax=Saccharothrix algeriensis TaxID=173560 RepID=A0A8T8HZE6_9PSEU|nr:sensor histidine kinase [Saccharothrix algeriensis]MBM7814845.1 anti-sigma regulatory factor (Ser/Thr protein kinase) [Saccharothrix algeriensis]QTR03124.1 sensor histidine kinase [Saccharothrix algeriensis]
MTTSAGAGTRGYDHAAVCYRSHDELLAVAVPFLDAGLRAGEAVVVSLDGEKTDLVRSALPGAADVTFLVGDDVYARPATAIKSYRELMTRLLAGGARRIRIFGEVPRAGLGARWDWWARYEAAVNHIYDVFPLRSMCGYDLRTTPRHVLDDVASTHPFVATPDGRLANDRYVQPPSFLSAPPAPADYPIQRTPPLVELVDPTPTAARRAVLAANRTRLTAEEVDDALLSVTEAVTNAGRHGLPPVRLRLWSDAELLVVTVHDRGAGPGDPFAGLLPASNRSTGGFGLWLTHQLCHHVAFARDEDGFTIRLAMGGSDRV